ncbi:CAP domain-containing protein [Granulicella arctica]|uniref:SCP domain-containing protein n=1 Tax=Granulicella arctica TaxID=940613 RepID=A0A7Y9PJG0_9BACT|nr:CAP domain-containing protein [Granulicella arctica]NYF80879.1 hypothetical protein [Granulicella arctica]
MRKFLLIPGVVLLALLTALCARAQLAPPSLSVAEQYLFSAINQERADRHLAPVRLDAALTQAAVFHAQQMVAHGTISHRFADEPELSARGAAAGAHFELITENVAEGATAVSVQDAWMRSPGHRANILDAAVDAVGISVLTRDGVLYAVEDFQRTVQSLTLEQQEAAVGLLLDQAGLELVPSEDARRTCAMSTGYAGDEQPAFVVRYTTANLALLPSQLTKRLGAGKDHRVAVGACAPARGGSFSTYSIAVVLYP